MPIAHVWLNSRYFDPKNIHAISIHKRSIAMGLGRSAKGKGGFPGAPYMGVFT